MTARKKASTGIQDLIDRTGGPKLVAEVVVDQPYAQDQHETMYYRHPRGGQAKYLETPLMSENAKWIERFAQRVLTRGELGPKWGGVGRALKDSVKKFAPVEFNDLRQSASLTVREGSSTIIDEPAAQHRLTDQEILGKDFLRSGGLGYRE